MIFHFVTSTLKCRCMQMIVASMLHISDEYIVEQQMNHDLHEIHTWLIANKLSLIIIIIIYNKTFLLRVALNISR